MSDLVETLRSELDSLQQVFQRVRHIDDFLDEKTNTFFVNKIT